MIEWARLHGRFSGRQQKHVRYQIYPLQRFLLSIPGAAIACSLELICDPKRILHLNQTNLFFAVKRRDAEKVQAKEETDSTTCPCSNVHMNRDGILNKMFEEFRCCLDIRTISYFILESKIVCCIVPCQLLVETYGLDINHRDTCRNGQTCWMNSDHGGSQAPDDSAAESCWFHRGGRCQVPRVVLKFQPAAPTVGNQRTEVSKKKKQSDRGSQKAWLPVVICWENIATLTVSLYNMCASFINKISYIYVQICWWHQIVYDKSFKIRVRTPFPLQVLEMFSVWWDESSMTCILRCTPLNVQRNWRIDKRSHLSCRIIQDMKNVPDYRLPTPLKKRKYSIIPIPPFSEPPNFRSCIYTLTPSVMWCIWYIYILYVSFFNLFQVFFLGPYTFLLQNSKSCRINGLSSLGPWLLMFQFVPGASAVAQPLHHTQIPLDWADNGKTSVLFSLITPNRTRHVVHLCIQSMKIPIDIYSIWLWNFSFRQVAGKGDLAARTRLGSKMKQWPVYFEWFLCRRCIRYVKLFV